MIDTYGISTLQPVYLPEPVNRQHPLNQGRVAWWLTLPELAGGKFFYDLMGLNPGTLTNMGSGSGWAGTTRPGGYGHLIPNTAAYGSGLIKCGNAPSLALSNIKTASFWFRQTQTSNLFQLLRCLAYDNGSATTTDFVVGIQDNGSGAFSQTFSAQVGGTGGNAYSTPLNSIVVGSWYRTIIVWNSSNVVTGIFLNGVSKTLTNQGNQFSTSNYAGWVIGNRGQADRGFAGDIDDISIWSRALSAVEVAEDYNLSRLGYPGVLNRISSFYSPAAIARIMAQNHLLGLTARRAS